MIKLCEIDYKKEATIMLGFVGGPNRGSMSSAALLCLKCFESVIEQYKQTGKIGQCVIMPLSNPKAIEWYNNA